MRFFIYISFLTAFLLAGVVAVSQPLLERKVTVHADHQVLEKVLHTIEDKAGFRFSYSPDAVRVTSFVTLHVNDRTVREVLNQLFNGSVLVKERRSHVLLLPAAKDPESTSVPVYLEGYAIDNASGKAVPDVSIYDPKTLVSTTTNHFGYYKIRIPDVEGPVILEVRKKEYAGRTLHVRTDKSTFLQLNLEPNSIREISGQKILLANADSIRSVFLPSLDSVVIPKYPDLPSDSTRVQRISADLRENVRVIRDEVGYAFASAKQLINQQNASEDSLFRNFQASILPFIGTNHQMSGSVTNRFSFNLIAGYSHGLKGLELGGLLNLVQNNASGVQMAGGINVAGRNVEGIQFAGLGNFTGSSTEGVVLSNIANITGEDFIGFQAAAFNVVGRSLEGIQIGLANYSSSVSRSGYQFGFVNYADTTSGIPLGVFSYVRSNGYRRIEVYADELFAGNFGFRTGIHRLYNIFSVSTNGFADRKAFFGLGYGLGTGVRLSGSWLANLDLTYNAIMFGKDLTLPVAKRFRLALTFEKRFGARAALAAGPTLNYLKSPLSGVLNSGEMDPVYFGAKPDELSTRYLWLGFQVALRFGNKYRL